MNTSVKVCGIASPLVATNRVHSRTIRLHAAKSQYFTIHISAPRWLCHVCVLISC